VGGLVFKAHRLVYRSTLGWRVIKKKERRWAISGKSTRVYMGTSLIRNSVPLGPYRRVLEDHPMVVLGGSGTTLWWS